jgi:hypothetical protein
MLAISAVIAIPGLAAAHERRDVDRYTFVVGWIVEPAFEGQKNGIDLRVTNTETTQPVEGVEKTLKAEVIFGGQRREFALRTIFRDPGHYTADIVPEREGDYRFRFFGTIDGVQINETFDSADGRFGGVESIRGIQFPETAASGQTTVASSPSVTTSSQSDSSQPLALVGVILGALGVGLGGLALVRSRGTS